MAYALENALYQWREGERGLAAHPEPARADLEQAGDAVVEELRRRLGSSFVVDELADLYGRGTDWARRAGRAPRGRRPSRRGRRTPRSPATSREASDFAGGRPRDTHWKP